jgi:hypothetical protein
LAGGDANGQNGRGGEGNDTMSDEESEKKGKTDHRSRSAAVQKSGAAGEESIVAAQDEDGDDVIL